MFEDIDVPEMKSVVRPRSAVEDMLERGRAFYRRDVHERRWWVGLPLALQDALAYAGPDGFVGTMPELIAARVAVAVPTGDPKIPFDESHWLWKDGYDMHSEENVGPNDDRRFYPDEEYLVVVVHGGGLLSPDRVFQAYDEGLVDGAARYAPEEFESLLRGRLPDGELPLYSYDEIAGQDLPRRCGIVLPYSRAARALSGLCSKREFLEHPLAIARNAGVQHLEEYFDRANWSRMLGCYHPFGTVNPGVPQGRLLFFHYHLHGLVGNENLHSDGRFLGVAPARR